jgi:ATP-dependent Clp protease ATP-binding subunit ClpC
MFERYTETARKAIFVARYEASAFGSPYIETEHLLLGILRSDGPLAAQLLKAPGKIASIRDLIEKQSVRREKTSTSVDLPLSHQCKRALAYGAEEAESMKHTSITTAHLFLGLLREQESVASKIMVENGVTASEVRQEAIRLSAAGTTATKPDSLLTKDARDLTAEARNASLSPLIGRESELERMIQILSRRTRNNPVLIGEPGVGKNTVVHGLAQRIADGAVPAILAGRRILAIDAASLRLSSFPEGADRANTILYIQGLFDLAGKGAGWGMLEAVHVLEPQLARGGLQCIATGTPFGLRLTVERAETLSSHFEVVSVLPPNEEEATQIVSGVKDQYEKFHAVVVTDEAIGAAISASRWFLRHRHLPDRAIDLIDDAGARVRLRCETEPREVVELEKRIRRINRQMENAIANHEFAKARLHSDEERKEQQSLERLREERKQLPPSNILTAEDVVEAVAGRVGMPVSIVKSVLQAKSTDPLELVAKELAAQVPFGGREWAAGLAAYLSACTAEEAERLAQAIRAAKTKIDDFSAPK